MIRVVIADDQAMVRSGLRMLLETEPDIEVVGEAADGEAAVRECHWRHPDVVLMDVQMPGVDGIEATRRIVASAESTRVLILTTFDLDEYLFEALRAGASGFLLKQSPADELIAAVRTISGGDALLAPAVTRRVISAVARRRPPGTGPASAVGRLSEREREVLVLVGRGLSNGEIASRLVVGEATVKTHVSSVFSKLGLRDRVSAVVFAYESGLIEPGEMAPGDP